MGRRSTSRVAERSPTGTQRGRAWGAIRNQARRGRGFSAGELHVLSQEAFGPAPDQTAANLKKWCRRLEAAGILARSFGCRGQEIQYRLARDLGPRCPVPREEGGVFDPNSGEVLEEIAPALRQAQEAAQAAGEGAAPSHGEEGIGGEAGAPPPALQRAGEISSAPAGAPAPQAVPRKRGRPRKIVAPEGLSEGASAAASQELQNAAPEKAAAPQGVGEILSASAEAPAPQAVRRKRGRPRKSAAPEGSSEGASAAAPRERLEPASQKPLEVAPENGAEALSAPAEAPAPQAVQRKRGRPRKSASPQSGAQGVPGLEAAR